MTKILVIEDEQTVRENIRERLEGEGYETIEAENGQIGVICAREQQPDLVICDVMMPELDGYEVINLLRRDPVTATIPFIFLSAKSDKVDWRQGMELGADDYLTKPFTKAELLGAVVARLERQAAIARESAQQLVELRDSLTEQRYTNADVLAQELAELKQAQFTGRVVIKSAAEQEWTLYLYLGRILYATGGSHPIRRWQRNLAASCPQIQHHQLHLPFELSNSAWEYHMLGLWMAKQKISREQAHKIIRAIVAEVLFDVLQAEQLVYQAQPEESLPRQLLLIDVEHALSAAQQAWQTWQTTTKVKDLSPNQAPALKQPEVLQRQTTAATYQQLVALLDGQKTLRDLALQMKRQVGQIISSLLPYIHAGVVELMDLADLPAPVTPTPATPVPPTQAATVAPLIACIDDSPLVCQSLEQILTEAGYQFVAVQDPLRAITTLLSRKPDLIFLDLVMPNMNGYEICSRLRKISAFSDTPIVILTSNIIDRVRAKVAGSSDFLAKPVKPETVLAVIDKYIVKANDASIEYSY